MTTNGTCARVLHERTCAVCTSRTVRTNARPRVRHISMRTVRACVTLCVVVPCGCGACFAREEKTSVHADKGSSTSPPNPKGQSPCATLSRTASTSAKGPHGTWITVFASRLWGPATQEQHCCMELNMVWLRTSGPSTR